MSTKQAEAKMGEIVEAVGGSIARAIRDLGNADASTPMGAIEAHGVAILEAASKIESGLQAIADAIREHAEV